MSVAYRIGQQHAWVKQGNELIDTMHHRSHLREPVVPSARQATHGGGVSIPVALQPDVRRSVEDDREVNRAAPNRTHRPVDVRQPHIISWQAVVDLGSYCWVPQIT